MHGEAKERWTRGEKVEIVPVYIPYLTYIRTWVWRNNMFLCPFWRWEVRACLGGVCLLALRCAAVRGGGDLGAGIGVCGTVCLALWVGLCGEVVLF